VRKAQSKSQTHKKAAGETLKNVASLTTLSRVSLRPPFRTAEPEADYLRDDIYELRVRHRSVNYRMLYFFHGKIAAVLSHGLKKEKSVPPKEIDLAVKRKTKFAADPERHTFEQ
jgi:phage-related protein